MSLPTTRSKTIDFLIKNPQDTLEREIYLGVNPTEEDAKHVDSKLDGFGVNGVQGFDYAIALFAILRGFSEHEELPSYENGELEYLSRPFTVCHTREGDAKHSDHGLVDGFNYGLHVLPKRMEDVSIYFPTIDKDVKLIAESTLSNRALIAQCVTNPDDMSFEYGYFGSFPDNVGRVCGYLVLPKPDAVEIVAEAAISDYLV